MDVRTGFLRSPLARLGLAGVAALGLATAAQAQTQTTPPSSNQNAATYSFSGTLLDSTGQQTAVANTFTATYTASVYQDTNNPFGSGDLTFVYQFTNTDSGSYTGAIERLTADDFTGFLVDAGYEAGTNVKPNMVTRTSNGQTVGFDFTGGRDVTAGQTSDRLIIKTNATQYQAGTVASLQDGSSVNIKGFKPISAAPEPSTWLLLMAGVGGLGMALRGQRRQKLSLRLA